MSNPPPRKEHDLQSAVALAYGTGDPAPRVVAKGRGLIAEEIIRRARNAGVFVHQSEELVAMLSGVDLDQYIPPELYLVVAELLAWLYRLEQGATGMQAPDSPPRLEVPPPERTMTTNSPREPRP